MLRRFGLACFAPRFRWECLINQTVSWFPAPATSNRACRFPALGSPARFTTRLMGRLPSAALSILALTQNLLHAPPTSSVFPWPYTPLISGPADYWTFYQAPLPPLPSWGLPGSRAPLLPGHYSGSPLLRTPPPPSRRQPLSRLRRLYDLPCSTDFAVGRGRLLQLLGLPLSPCCP